MLLLLIMFLTFTGLTLAVMSIYWMFARPTSTMNARLESIDPSLALVENNPITVMAGRAVEPPCRRPNHACRLPNHACRLPNHACRPFRPG